MRLTLEEYKALKAKNDKACRIDGFTRNYKNSKYHNKPITVDGVRFASMKEANRHSALLALEKAGAISELKLQPKFLLQDKFDSRDVHYQAIYYVGDFQYIDRGQVIVEDVKGKKVDKKGKVKFYTTEVFNLKKKLFIKKYPNIELRMV